MHDELTKVDIQKMQEEIDYRKSIASELRETVKAAREQGDLSENDEYHTARKKMRANIGRIQYLESMIASAVVIEDNSSSDEIGLFDEVDIYYDGDKEDTDTVRVVTTLRNDVTNGCISKESPLGAALLGKKAGETFHVTVNEKVHYDVTVVAIRKGEDDKSLEIKKY